MVEKHAEPGRIFASLRMNSRAARLPPLNLLIVPPSLIRPVPLKTTSIVHQRPPLVVVLDNVFCSTTSSLYRFPCSLLSSTIHLCIAPSYHTKIAQRKGHVKIRPCFPPKTEISFNTSHLQRRLHFGSFSQLTRDVLSTIRIIQLRESLLQRYSKSKKTWYANILCGAWSHQPKEQSQLATTPTFPRPQFFFKPPRTPCRRVILVEASNTITRITITQ